MKLTPMMKRLVHANCKGWDAAPFLPMPLRQLEAVVKIESTLWDRVWHRVGRLVMRQLRYGGER